MNARTIVCVLFLGLTSMSGGLASIVIKELTGAESAQLGANTTTLRCDFQYQNESGVEVKWFYNQNLQIFTWVPTLNSPQAMGPFSANLEVDNNTIRFRETLRNMTGNYTCKVSSDGAEEAKTQTMIVYQPARIIEFFPEELSETLICSAYDLYPQPNITIAANYASGSNDTIVVTEEDETISDTEDNFYNVTKTFKFDKERLHGTARFVCNIAIPDTDYVETRTVTFEKRDDESSSFPEYFDYGTGESSTETTVYTRTKGAGDLARPTSAPSLYLMMMTATVAFAMTKL